MIQTKRDKELARIKAEYHRREATPVIFRRYHLENAATRLNLESIHCAIRKTFHSHGIVSLAGKRILDIGCGNGSWLRRLVESYGATQEQCVGIDLMEEHIATASTISPEMEWHVGSADALPFTNASFDLLLCFTVFSSVLDEILSEAIAHEMWRVLVPGGFLLWYDFVYNNPRNPAVHGISEKRVRALFPSDADVDVQHIILAPPLSRMFAARAYWFARSLERCKVLNTHLLMMIQKGDIE